MLSVFMYIGMYMKDDSVNTFTVSDTPLIHFRIHISTFAFECYCAQVQPDILLVFKIQRCLSETYSAIACIKDTSTETICITNLCSKY